MGYELYVCEKGSQAQALAEVMGLKRSGRGYEGSYGGRKCRIVYLSGHIMRLYDVKDYLEEEGKIDEFLASNGKLSWKTLDEKLVPFIPKKFKKKVKSASDDKKSGRSTGTKYGEVFRQVKKACREADAIVLSPDPDDEGVTLAMEVVEASGAVGKVKGMIKLNALEEGAIRNALRELDTSRWRYHYRAGESRSEYDWAFGINLTIKATVAFGTLIHVGGVKTPTVRLVVERDLENENFEKRYLYGVEAKVEAPNGNEFTVKFKLDTENEKEAKDLASKILSKGTLKVEDFVKAKKRKEPPLPFSKTQLQTHVSRMGISLKESNTILQRLYEKKFSSYPRSSCNYYSTALHNEIGRILKAISKDSLVGKFANLNPPYRKNRAFNDAEVDKHSHTALAPQAKYDESSLNEKEKKVWRTIAKRFLAQLYPPYEYLSVKGTTEFGGAFEENVKISDGWQAVEKIDDHPSERKIPDLSAGDVLTVKEAKVTKKETKPKPKFTKATLAKAMENIASVYGDETLKKFLGTGKNAKGIGTEATRDVIIEQLVAGGYFVVEGKKEVLTSTKKARDMIKALDDYITSPLRRAELEAELEKIRDGKSDPASFRKRYEDFVEMCCDIIDERSGKVCVSSSRPPTPKMVKYMKALATANGVKIPNKAMEDMKEASAFIERYAKKNERSGYGFSEKQLEIIEKYADEEIKSLAKADGMEKEDWEKARKALDEIFKSWKKKPKTTRRRKK